MTLQTTPRLHVHVAEEDDEPDRPSFHTWTEALTEAEALMQRFPRAEVVIEDLAWRIPEPALDPFIHAYRVEAREAKRGRPSSRGARPDRRGLVLTWAAFGAAPSGARRERLEASPNWRGGRFVNTLPPRHDVASALVKWIRGAPDREPRVEIPVIPRRADEFAKPPPSGLRATWLGHSSTLIEIGGRRFLTDPVFSRRISPSPFVGPRRFFASPIAAADLPDLDAIVLSHDHFDHLDLETVRALRPTTFVVPLGVGAHLASWGIPEERIVELDWWQSTDVGGVELVCTPARHFSGRSPTTRDATLWCGWAFVAPRHRVFFSGDTALFPGFSEIGQRLGPFDLTLMESGAYDAAWADVHIGPEQAVRAHEMLRGRVMLPVHWGTFNLALHPWTEPAERALVAARTRGVTLVVPRPGESIDPLSPPQAVRWWPELPWTRAEQAPVISSGMLAEAG